MKLLLLISLSIISLASFTQQNLVPNGSFEEIKSERLDKFKTYRLGVYGGWRKIDSYQEFRYGILFEGGYKDNKKWSSFYSASFLDSWEGISNLGRVFSRVNIYSIGGGVNFNLKNWIAKAKLEFGYFYREGNFPIPIAPPPPTLIGQGLFV